MSGDVLCTPAESAHTGEGQAAARAAWVAERAESFSLHYARVAGGHPGHMAYAPSAPELADLTSPADRVQPAATD